MTLICAVDPGNTTGWAYMKDGKPDAVGTVPYGKVFYDWLDSVFCDVFVVEDYKIRPAHMQGGYEHLWNSGIPMKIIGAIEYYAYRKNIPVVLQQPSIKPIGYKMMGAEYKKGKSGMHVHDALAHGTYYFRKAENGKRSKKATD